MSYDFIEVNNSGDYKSIEKLGLLPTDRDPSAWLRMVARVFAAYKEVDINKTIVSYIDGFQILNDELGIPYITNNMLEFRIKKGTCFIDNQFIGFLNDIIFKTSIDKLINGNQYFLVLYYKWSYETDYNVAEFRIVDNTTFDDQTMLRIATFDYDAGEINLYPQDLDDLYADNYKKLSEIIAERIVSSLETTKMQFLVFDNTEEKIAPETKSGDFVTLDYSTMKYKPAKSCFRTEDKVAGVYLKKNNNKDYIIFNGVVDFGDPAWEIDNDRLYLKTLEPGSSYYLLDNCTTSDIYNLTLACPSTDGSGNDAWQEYCSANEKIYDPGKITPFVYPGLVKVGFALTPSSMLVQMDYSSDIDMRNFIELFGDSERFDEIYKIFYNYYSVKNKIDFLEDNNSLYTDIINDLNDKINDESTMIDTETASLNSLNDNVETQKESYTNTVDNSKLTISNNYSTLKSKFISRLNEIVFKKSFNLKNKNDLSQYLINAKIYLQNVIDNFESIKNNDDYSKILGDDAVDEILKNNSLQFINDLQTLIQDSINYIDDSIKFITSGTIQYIKSETNITSPLDYWTITIYDKDSEITDDIVNNVIFYDKVVFTGDDDTEALLETFKNKYNENINKIIQKVKDANFYFKTGYLPGDSINYTSLINSDANEDTHKYYYYQNTLAKLNNGSTNTTVARRDMTLNTKDVQMTTSFLETEYYNYSISASSVTNQTISYTGENNNEIIYIENYREFVDEFLGYSASILDTYTKVLEVLEMSKQFSNYLVSIISNIKISRDYGIDWNNIASNETPFNNIYNTNYNLMDARINALQMNTKLDTDKYIKNYLNGIYSKFSEYSNTTIGQIEALKAELQNLYSLYQPQLEDTLVKKTISIYSISEYQRNVYNYTYLVTRIKLKANEYIKIQNTIDLISEKIEELNQDPTTNAGLIASLQNLNSAYTTLQNQINNEMLSMVQELNKIRTEKFGEEPVDTDVNNLIEFDPGQYYQQDLTCLEINTN